MTLQPMNTFDPSKPCKVHDGLTDCTFDWKPKWAANYREHAEPHSRGDPSVINWDDLLISLKMYWKIIHTTRLFLLVSACRPRFVSSCRNGYFISSWRLTDGFT
jgi:hypothetical protein